MSRNYDKLHSRSIIASAPVPAHRFVNRAGGAGGDDVVGVSESPCTPGQTITVITGYSAIVETAAAIAQGDLVDSDAAGRAVVAAGLGLGVAESAAPAGGRVEVRLHGLLGKALHRLVSIGTGPGGGIEFRSSSPARTCWTPAHCHLPGTRVSGCRCIRLNR
ncbi:hypothetical protein TMEC54S_03523 [Thauera mechernichensis]